LIWGYEEPENNLEMFTSFELAENFYEYSKGIQILITTHSPGFYSLCSKYEKDSVYLYKVFKGQDSISSILKLESPSEMDIDMGLMPVIAPYVAEKSEEIKNLKDNIQHYTNELKKIHSNVVFVEGSDEVNVFSTIFRKHANHTDVQIKNDGLGCSGVKNQLMAWSWISGVTTYKAFGIFDNDLSGSNEFNKLQTEDAYKNAVANKKVKGLKYKVPGHLLNIKNKIPSFPIELEEMYSPVTWEHAKTMRWIVPRTAEQLNAFVKLDEINQTIEQKLIQMKFSAVELLYIKFYVPDKHKSKLSKFVTTTDRIGIEKKCESLVEFIISQVVPFFK
jgi:hypothetical protein